MSRRVSVVLVTALLLAGLPEALLNAAPGAPALPLLSGPVVAVDTAAQDQFRLYDVGSGVVRTLDFDGRWVRLWGFSPDGCRILYTQQEGLVPGALYSARLDGSDRRSLVRYSGSETWGVWEPAWSPSAADPRIAFTLVRSAGGETSHHIAFIDGQSGAGSSEPAFYSVSGDEHTARWSPDGRWLVYAAYETRTAGADVFSTAAPGQSGAQLREADLWIVSADGTTKYRLTDFPTGSVTMPRWSPDGDLISFVYSAQPGFDTVWMIGMEPGSAPTQITYGASVILDLTWQPDGAALTISTREFNGMRENRLWRIGLVGGADASAEQIITDAALRYHDYPRYSADGGWLALRAEYGLALVDTRAGGWQWLERDALGNTPPVWTPAGFQGEAACA
ncbi:MAG: PD40 domain-containing protein [Anaerolineae bacterium]|nr:PD40 domain-containing protein [Anaerolineae bacterium]